MTYCRYTDDVVSPLQCVLSEGHGGDHAYDGSIEVQRGWIPATTIPGLVDSLRQSLAGAGADIYSLRIMLEGQDSRQEMDESYELPLSDIVRIWMAVTPRHGSHYAELQRFLSRLHRAEEALDRLEGHVSSIDRKATQSFEKHYDGLRTFHPTDDPHVSAVLRAAYDELGEGT